MGNASQLRARLEGPERVWGMVLGNAGMAGRG